MIGLPVFSGFQGGVGHLLGPTGGYIIGFIAMGAIYTLVELFTKKLEGKKKLIIEITSLVSGLLICYLIGTIWFYVLMKGDYTFFKVLLICVIPYLGPDLLKLVLAIIISRRLKKVIYHKEENDYE